MHFEGSFSVPGKPGNVVEIAPAKKLGKNIN